MKENECKKEGMTQRRSKRDENVGGRKEGRKIRKYEGKKWIKINERMN